jgi:protoheme ferro-lyase
MNKNIELRLRYNQLIIEGKEKDAWLVLNEIWDLDKGIKHEDKPKEIPLEKIVSEKKEDKVEQKYKTISDLSKISGISKSTIKKLEKDYQSIDNIINVIKNGNNLKIPKYIENKIKKELNL